MRAEQEHRVPVTASSLAQTESPRPLAWLDLTCVGINAIVGSSIFLFPGKLALLLGPASLLAFGLTALLLMPVALCFAKASSLFDGHGGPYLYTRQAFGRHAGYAIGWMCWITVILSWAAVANGLTIYLGYLAPVFSRVFWAKAAAVSVISLLGFVNYRGVKLGAWTSNAFTFAKLAPLALFVIVGLPKIQAAHYQPWAPHGWSPLGAGCFLAYFAFQGFEVVPAPAGEAARARRNVPRALLSALALASVLYMLIQGVAVGVDPGLAGSNRPLAHAAAQIMGPAGATIIVLGALFSMLGFNAGCALGGPRYLVALAQHGDWPQSLSALHSRHQTPFRAVLLTAALAGVAALLLDFIKLVNISNIVLCAQYLATCAAVPVICRQQAGPGRPIGRYWLLAIAGMASTLWLGAQGKATEVVVALLLLCCGFLLRAVLWSRRKAASNQPG